MDNSNWNKKQDSDNYQRLLDNLIDIKRNDSCLFAKVDNSDFIDLVDFLSKQDRRKISVQPTFAIYLSNDSLQKKKEKIEKALSADEIYELAEEYRTEVEKKFSKALNQDFEEAKKKKMLLIFLKKKFKNLQLSEKNILEKQIQSMLKETFDQFILVFVTLALKPILKQYSHLCFLKK
ncbi:hypothetical protein [Mesomycoplasma hyorhinis]|uniref:hypothetical protein n=1 Tax=Mesomycoplasma hyorhinis TaxID=2100 RepID=UPI00059D9E20